MNSVLDSENELIVSRSPSSGCNPSEEVASPQQSKEDYFNLDKDQVFYFVDTYKYNK